MNIQLEELWSEIDIVLEKRRFKLNHVSLTLKEFN